MTKNEGVAIDEKRKHGNNWFVYSGYCFNASGHASRLV